MVTVVADLDMAVEATVGVGVAAVMEVVMEEVMGVEGLDLEVAVVMEVVGEEVTPVADMEEVVEEAVAAAVNSTQNVKRFKICKLLE